MLQFKDSSADLVMSYDLCLVRNYYGAFDQIKSLQAPAPCFQDLPAFIMAVSLSFSFFTFPLPSSILPEARAWIPLSFLSFIPPTLAHCLRVLTTLTKPVHQDTPDPSKKETLAMRREVKKPVA